MYKEGHSQMDLNHVHAKPHLHIVSLTLNTVHTIQDFIQCDFWISLKQS